MFCSQCGKEIMENSKFCSFCGASLQNFDKPVQVEELEQAPFIINGAEFDIVSMKLSGDFKKDTEIFKYISNVTGVPLKSIHAELEYQRLDIIKSRFKLTGFVDRQDDTIVGGIQVLDRLQKARLGAKELRNISKELKRLHSIDTYRMMIVNEYLNSIAKEYQIKGSPWGPSMCPVCGSTNIEISGRKFSKSKAVAGGLLLGPIGVVAGCGSGKVNYHCNSCRRDFKNIFTYTAV